MQTFLWITGSSALEMVPARGTRSIAVHPVGSNTLAGFSMEQNCETVGRLLMPMEGQDSQGRAVQQ